MPQFCLYPNPETSNTCCSVSHACEQEFRKTSELALRAPCTSTATATLGRASNALPAQCPASAETRRSGPEWKGDLNTWLCKILANFLGLSLGLAAIVMQFSQPWESYKSMVFSQCSDLRSCLTEAFSGAEGMSPRPTSFCLNLVDSCKQAKPQCKGGQSRPQVTQHMEEGCCQAKLPLFCGSGC